LEQSEIYNALGFDVYVYGKEETLNIHRWR